jgi:PAS domain S-box-containing protein
LGSSDAKRLGHRTTLGTPMLREQTPIGGILFRRFDVRPFSNNQIALLESFADQAAIAIENVRLFEAEKQRSLALAQANRDLAEREAKIRRLVDANIIGILVWTMDGRFIEANDAFLGMVGYDREELISDRVHHWDLTPPEWHKHLESTLAELKATGTAQPYEKEYFRKDGSRVPVLVGAAAFDEKRDRGVAFVLDLTERKRAEEAMNKVQMELAHANRVSAMGQLTASVAHEIRQPLAGVKAGGNAALRWLTKHPPGLEEAKRSLENIIKTADRANDVISRIHNIVKKGSSNKDALDINEAILEVLTLVRGEAVKHNVSIQMRLATNLPRIVGDRVQLQQVMINLVINAIQAMSAVQGMRELHISTERSETDGVSVAVRDFGPGLSAQDLSNLFEPFYTTKPEGMGMGLSISRTIIEYHGGRLWASQSEPHGALFQFTIPAI